MTHVLLQVLASCLTKPYISGKDSEIYVVTFERMFNSRALILHGGSVDPLQVVCGVQDRVSCAHCGSVLFLFSLFALYGACRKNSGKQQETSRAFAECS